MADTQTQVQTQSQNQNQGTVTQQKETAVQSGIFGGSAEAVDAMVNPVPAAKQNENSGDSGETFNFDEIDFGKQEVVKEEEVVNPEAVKPLSSDEDLPLTRESEEDEEIIEDEDKIEDKIEEKVEVVKDASLQNMFDIMYASVEHIYKMKEMEASAELSITDTEYSFVIKDLAIDTIDIHKADINISFSLENDSLDVFVKGQHLFSAADLKEHEDKMTEVSDKMKYFVDLIEKEEAIVEGEVASKKAEEEKNQMFEHFKTF